MNGTTRSAVSRRWLVLGLCVVLVTGSLVFVGWALWARTDGLPDPIEAAQSLREDQNDPLATGAEMRDLAEEFVVEFHTYGPDDLENGELTGYWDRVSVMMTSKFKTVFEQQIQLPAATVAEVKNGSQAEAQASGVVTADADSAEVLVGGVITTSYQNPNQESERIESDPMPVRYRVLMVKVDGAWLVDDLDQVGDDLPGFAEQGGEATQQPGGTDPSGLPTPTDGTAPTEPVPTDPTDGATEDGGDQ